MKLIFNLSQKILTEHHSSVLSKGLTFVPVSRPAPLQVDIELYKIQRTLTNYERWKDNPTTADTSTQITKNPFKIKYKGDQKTSNISIKTFMQSVKNESEMILKNPTDHRQNLSKAEKIALKDLMTDPNIIIRPADKGGVIVVMAYDKYKEEI
ncbi:Hypothetical predicted protein, partial [Pelobates cultripes]